MFKMVIIKKWDAVRIHFKNYRKICDKPVSTAILAKGSL
jgi:hypothetical protein